VGCLGDLDMLAGQIAEAKALLRSLLGADLLLLLIVGTGHRGPRRQCVKTEHEGDATDLHAIDRV
jgi:hypothetical protein